MILRLSKLFKNHSASVDTVGESGSTAGALKDDLHSKMKHSQPPMIHIVMGLFILELRRHRYRDIHLGHLESCLTGVGLTMIDKR